MKTLIIYSTKHGTAEKAASILKSKLSGEVHLVNIMNNHATALESYDTIILGGSIYVESAAGQTTFTVKFPF